MKFLLAFLFIALSFSFSQPEKVYLCMGSRSYAYHLYKSCRAFDRCTTRIYSMGKEEAVNDKKRSLCKWCKEKK